jgi:hypothetical protein
VAQSRTREHERLCFPPEWLFISGAGGPMRSLHC